MWELPNHIPQLIQFCIAFGMLGLAMLLGIMVILYMHIRKTKCNGSCTKIFVTFLKNIRIRKEPKQNIDLIVVTDLNKIEKF